MYTTQFRIYDKNGQLHLESFLEQNYDTSGFDTNHSTSGYLYSHTLGISGTSGVSGKSGSAGITGISGTSGTGIPWINYTIEQHQPNKNGRIYPNNVFMDSNLIEKEKVEETSKYNSLGDYFPTFT